MTEPITTPEPMPLNHWPTSITIPGGMRQIAYQDGIRTYRNVHATEYLCVKDWPDSGPWPFMDVVGEEFLPVHGSQVDLDVYVLSARWREVDTLVWRGEVTYAHDPTFNMITFLDEQTGEWKTVQPRPDAVNLAAEERSAWADWAPGLIYWSVDKERKAYMSLMFDSLELPYLQEGEG